uniref:HAT C-terminal dimerisation domain-containing protein n=1 Tax=Rhizophagus irregularis (strain DAOM 181602 / DAOM 197198 / MUCL 43194) TaxID=747089 RepID=U9UVP6_RHIID
MIKLRILIWDASDISNERERLIEVMPKRFKKSAASSIRISRNCISSLLYAQCQLAISAIFKESSALKITSSNDIIVAAYFKNANNKGTYRELGAVALKIFGICVNAASVERMWSSMGFLHTVRHNRLMVS